MEAHDKAKFLQMLTRVMGAYGKPLPDPSIIEIWIDMLRPFPLVVIGKAFTAYCDENGEFAPVPAGIAKRCKLMDGRPSDDEAWAVALTSRSEFESVVWTAETAEAFRICETVLNAGDEVGARMAFKNAYNRLVAAARVDSKPCEWRVSLGWDQTSREVAVKRAVASGLLTANAAVALLPNYSPESAEAAGSADGLARVKQLLSTMTPAHVMLQQQREEQAEAERQATAQRKAELSRQAAGQA